MSRAGLPNKKIKYVWTNPKNTFINIAWHQTQVKDNNRAAIKVDSGKKQKQHLFHYNASNCIFKIVSVMEPLVVYPIKSHI
jgi:hypothetical protein